MTILKISTKAAPIHYLIEPLELNAHLFRITLTIAQPAMTQHVSLPVWIPGSYLVREFAKNLQNVTASRQKVVGGRAVRQKLLADRLQSGATFAHQLPGVRARQLSTYRLAG